MKSARICILLLTTLCLMGCQKVKEQTARQFYEQGVKTYESDSLQESERLCQLAIRKAKQEKDLHTQYLAQLQLAQSLSWGNANRALNMAKQALDTYKQKNDNERNHIIILDYIGTYASQCAYNGNSDFSEALRYANKANELALSLKDTTLISQTYTTLANIQWAMGNYEEALRMARESVRLATPDLLLGAQQVLARCLRGCELYDEAEEVYSSMDYGNDVQAAYIVESNLAKLALRRHDMDAAETAIDEAFERAENLYFHALGEKDAYYQATLKKEHETEHLRYTARLHRLLLLCGSLLLIALVVLALREIRLRRREQEMFKREAESQQEQLRQRDASVDFLKNFIYQRSEVVQKLSSSGNDYVSLSKGEWAEVERMLDTIDNNRFARLRELHPEIKEEDLQLCILTRLRLSNRAIGNVYAISISAVQHRKLKIKKEVFGETNPDTTLEQVLDKM